MSTLSPVGSILRQWRKHRRMSQLDLAETAEVSTRHLSCVETGKSRASPEMLLVLASALEIPLASRNELLRVAGYAAAYSESKLEEPDGHMDSAIQMVLDGVEPNPALAMDRAWNLVRLNRPAEFLFGAIIANHDGQEDPDRLRNAMLMLLHDAFRQVIVNWEDVAASAIERLHREAASHPGPDGPEPTLRAALDHPWLPSRFHRPELEGSLKPFIEVVCRLDATQLRFFTTLQTLGSPIDVTASSLLIETYFPSDATTRAWLQSLAASNTGASGADTVEDAPNTG